MVLWLLAFIPCTIYIVSNKYFNTKIVIAIVFYFSSLIVSACIGIINGISINSIALDLKQFCYFAIILYVSINLKTEKSINIIKHLLMYSSLILAIIHIIMAFFLILNIFNFDQLWYFFNIYMMQDSAINNGVSNEIFFKGEYGFIYYKGDFYLCTGLFFWYYSLKINWKKNLAILIIVIAIFLTGTRGFMLMIFLTLFIDWFLYRKNITFFLIDRYLTIFLFLSFSFLFYLLYAFNREYSLYLGDKELSDSLRYIQIEEVIKSITFLSFFVGHGLGFGVPSRPDHMEIAFLEIFHKQGIIGIALWVYLILLVFLLHKKCKNLSFSKPFWLSVLFTYLVSITNPYMNHPLGLMMISFSLVSLSSYSQVRNSSLTI